MLTKNNLLISLDLLLRCLQRLSFLPWHELLPTPHMQPIESGYLQNFTELYCLPKYRSKFTAFCAINISNLIDRKQQDENRKPIQSGYHYMK